MNKRINEYYQHMKPPLLWLMRVKAVHSTVFTSISVYISTHTVISNGIEYLIEREKFKVLNLKPNVD